MRRYLFALLMFVMTVPMVCLEAATVCFIADWTRDEDYFFNSNRLGIQKTQNLIKKRLEELGHTAVLMEKEGDFKGADYIVVYNYPHNFSAFVIHIPYFI